MLYLLTMQAGAEKLGKLIKQQRVAESLTLQELAEKSGVSSSHLGRIERGERFPSGQILRKVAKPLGFDENELFTLAGYLTPKSGVSEKTQGYTAGELDPWVARTLAQEPVEIQRMSVSVITILKSMARSFAKKD